MSVDRFDLEQQIMNCWQVVDDIKALRKQYMDVGNMTQDQIDNYLLGLETIYQVKFEQLFDTFEGCVHERQFVDNKNIPDSAYPEL